MIKELLDQIKTDSQADEIEYTHRITRLHLDIEELEIILRNLGIERSATTGFIQDVTQELTSLGETLSNLESQMEILNGKEEEIRDIRLLEKTAY